MKWKLSPKIKIYEALGCLADNRLEISDSQIKVNASNLNKFYTVKFDQDKNAIMANDNGSYWAKYLGYPSIAYLMKIGKLPFNEKYSKTLKNIKWKEINTKNKNSFEKTILEIDKKVEKQGININKFHNFINKIENEIKVLNLNLLGKRQFPPKEN